MKKRQDNKLKAIYLLTVCHNRAWLTGIVLAYYRKMSEKYDWLKLLCVGDSEKDEKLAKENGWNFVMADNEKLGKKFNTGVNYLKGKKFDGMILVGSDDFLNEKYFEFINNNRAVDFIGFRDMYFYMDSKLYYFEYGNKNHCTLGAGRYFSYNLIKEMNYKLWDDDICRGLDSNCYDRIKENIIHEKIISVKDGFVLVDIKTEDNMNPVLLSGGEADKKILDFCKEGISEIDRYYKENKRVDLEFVDKKIYKVIFNGNVVELEGSTARALYKKNLIKLVK